MTMVHLVDPHHSVCASSTVSGRLAEAFVRTQSHRVSRILCRRLYMSIPMSLVKLHSIHFPSAANGTTPLSWSENPHLDSERSTQ
jgi:hypothetical protein